MLTLLALQAPLVIMERVCGGAAKNDRQQAGVLSGLFKVVCFDGAGLL